MWTARAINILNRLKYQTLSSTLLLGLSFNGMVFGADKNDTNLLHTYSVPHVLSISHQKINPVHSSCNWQTREFKAAEHSEKLSATRLDIPFQFLF